MNGWSASHGLTNKNDCYDWMNDLQSAAIRIFFERIIRIIQKSGFWTDNPDVDQRIIPLHDTNNPDNAAQDQMDQNAIQRTLPKCTLLGLNFNDVHLENNKKKCIYGGYLYIWAQI